MVSWMTEAEWLLLLAVVVVVAIPFACTGLLNRFMCKRWPDEDG